MWGRPLGRHAGLPPGTRRAEPAVRRRRAALQLAPPAASPPPRAASGSAASSARTGAPSISSSSPPARTACCPAAPVARAATPRRAARCARFAQRLRRVAPSRALRRRAIPSSSGCALARRHPHPHWLFAQRRGGVQVRPRQPCRVRDRACATPGRRGGCGGVDGAVAEAQQDLAAARRHLENAAAFFRLLRTAPVGRIEHHAIARLQRRQRRAPPPARSTTPPSATRATRPISTPRCRGARPLHHRLMIRSR